MKSQQKFIHDLACFSFTLLLSISNEDDELHVFFMHVVTRLKADNEWCSCKTSKKQIRRVRVLCSSSTRWLVPPAKLFSFYGNFDSYQTKTVRKGRKRWRKKGQVVVVSSEQQDFFVERWPLKMTVENEPHHIVQWRRYYFVVSGGGLD